VIEFSGERAMHLVGHSAPGADGDVVLDALEAAHASLLAGRLEEAAAAAETERSVEAAAQKLRPAEAAGAVTLNVGIFLNSVISFVRTARDGTFLVVVLNFTPVPRHGYRIGVPRAGIYRELFNSDSHHYGGGDLGNASTTSTTAAPHMGLPASLVLTLPPLAGLILAPV